MAPVEKSNALAASPMTTALATLVFLATRPITTDSVPELKASLPITTEGLFTPKAAPPPIVMPALEVLVVSVPSFTLLPDIRVKLVKAESALLAPVPPF